MAVKVTRSILSAKFGTVDMLKPRSHDFSLQRTDIIHGAGADQFATTISAENKWWQVIVGFDDANSVAALTAIVDTVLALEVKDLNHGSATAGRIWDWGKTPSASAVLMDVTGAERFAVVGEFAAVFAVPSADGATNPLAITEF